MFRSQDVQCLNWKVFCFWDVYIFGYIFVDIFRYVFFEICEKIVI